MVDDSENQFSDEAQAATSAPRRRRSASRPAGPPAVETPEIQLPESAEAAPEQLGFDDAAPEAPVDAPEAEEVDEVAAAQGPDVDGPEVDEPGADEPGADEPGADEPGADEAGADGERAGAERDLPSGEPTPDAAAGPDSDATITAEPTSTPAPDVAEAPAAPARRSRRATRGVTTVAFSAVPEPVVPEAAGAPGEVPVAAVFQPPDETRAVRRQRRERPTAAQRAEAAAQRAEAAGAEGDEADQPDEATGDLRDSGSARTRPSREESTRGGNRRADAAEDTDFDEPDTDAEDREDRDDSEDADGAPRRRRRRGGRRRRRPGQGAGEDGEAREDADSEAEPADRQDAPAGSTEAEDSDEEPDVESEGDEASESPSARRRRRRRRRAGVAEEMEDLSTDDPPNTVVKVRESRKPSDEITSVRGSTRIEAKKQRRRDGREASRRRAPILTEAEFLARRESVNRVMCVREHGDRTQIAVLEDDVLVEHYVNRHESSSMVGNVYLGKVQNVLPSMEAAFVDIGRGRNAVLYAGEVNWEAAGLEGQPKRIELALKSGDPILVQVTKDPIGHKGARLTSQISLPGRFLVYVPEGSMTGISRKLPDTERARLKGILKDVVPEGAGVIVRTAAEGASEEQLTADVHRLTAQWTDIQKKSKSASAPALLYGEPDLAIKVVRDIFNEDFTSLVVQGESTWETLREYIGWVAPDLLPKLTRWVEPTELYSAHRIDEQLSKALDRKVWLPSGGSLVIDRTEAMTVVDVNTGKFTGQGGNLEETVTKNNLEAAEEIVRQLRLRDIGGIIVVDFIDMVLESNRDLVLRRLVECLGRDRTKHQVAEVTSLGLVQMTRKRIGQGLLEVFSVPCEHCGGRGHIIQAEPVDGDSGSEEQPRRGGERGDRGRRGSRGTQPVNLGGKQTGKTPPPPKFDEQGHVDHHGEEHAAPSEQGVSDAVEETAEDVAATAVVVEEVAVGETVVETAAEAPMVDDVAVDDVDDVEVEDLAVEATVDDDVALVEAVLVEAALGESPVVGDGEPVDALGSAEDPGTSDGTGLGGQDADRVEREGEPGSERESESASERVSVDSGGHEAV